MYTSEDVHGIYNPCSIVLPVGSCFFTNETHLPAAKEQELKQQASRARLEIQASRQVDQSKARQASMSTSEPAGVAGATGHEKIEALGSVVLIHLKRFGDIQLVLSMKKSKGPISINFLYNFLLSDLRVEWVFA